MTALLMEQLHFAKGIDPVADAFDTVVRSDVYNMEGLYRALFVLYIGVGATGSSTITVNACDNTTPSTRSAVPFRYREILATDVEGAITAATTAGYVTTVGSSKIILVEVDASALATSGYGYIELTATESVNSPVLGSVMFIGGEIRNRPAILPTVLT